MVDSEPLQKEAWQMAAGEFGGIIDRGLFEQGFGLRPSEFAVLVCRRLGLSAEPEDVIRRALTAFLKILPGRLRPMPGLFALMDWLRAEGIPCALVTSGVRAYADIVLRELRLQDRFRTVVTGDDVKQGKPAPDCYRLAAERLGLTTAAGLALEDAPNGIKAAKDAGMICWAVPNADTASLDLSEADRIYTSLCLVREALAG